MANKDPKLLNKRLAKPKTQYSPSNQTLPTTYHLIRYNDTQKMMIVGNSSVKRFIDDNTMVLNDGHTAHLIVSGTKDKCIQSWNKQPSTSNNNRDAEFDEEEDNAPDLMPQTLQMPAHTFLTPGPIRRKRTSIIRSNSPDSIFSASSPKRRNHDNHSKNLKRVAINNASSSRDQSHITTMNSPISSSDDEDEDADSINQISLSRIFRELQSTQENIRDVRSENRDIHQELTKLAAKINKFSYMVSSKKNEDFESYRDPDSNEIFRNEIPFQGRDLLDIPARNIGEYARSLLKHIFKQEELEECLLPSPYAKRFSKKQLDQERFDLLNEAIRTRYRISKRYYVNFYKDRIQDTLSNCLYNEGIRKKKKQSLEEQNPQQQDSQQQSQIGMASILE